MFQAELSWALLVYTFPAHIPQGFALNSLGQIPA